MARPNRGPHLSRKPNKFGMWDICWTDSSGRSRRRSSGESNHASAQKVLAKFILLIDRDDRPDGSPLVSDVLEAYWNGHVLKRVIGRGTQRNAIDHLASSLGHLKPGEIDQVDIDDHCERRAAGKVHWIDHVTGLVRGGQKAGPAALRRELSVLSAAMHYGTGLRPALVAVGDVPRFTRPDEPAPKDRVITEAEASRILASAMLTYDFGEVVDDPRLTRCYRAIMLFLHTAARKTAVTELTWFQVDLERRLIRYNPEGRRQTAKRRPAVPISDELYPVLVRAKAEATSEYVLDHPGSLRATFRTACRHAGLVDVTPHTLRHTWATWAARSGVSLWDIAGVLGDRVETVTRRYAHHSPDYLRNAVNLRPNASPGKGDTKNG